MSLPRGYPHPVPDWRVPHPVPIQYPSQVRTGYPYQDWMGVPPLRLDGGTPPPNLDWVPPIRAGWGYPPPPLPRRQSSRASTCYAAGGMPLAFTQEDFLVDVFWVFSPLAYCPHITKRNMPSTRHKRSAYVARTMKQMKWHTKYPPAEINLGQEE